MDSSLPTLHDVMASPAGQKFRDVESRLALTPEHIANWVRRQARHTDAAGLSVTHKGHFITLGVGRRVWTLFPAKHITGSEPVAEAIVICHPSMNGMDPHHFYKGLATCLATGKPVFMIPASTRLSPWRLPKWQQGDYLGYIGSHLLDFVREAIAGQKHIAFVDKLRLHLQGWSQGGTLALAMAGSLTTRSSLHYGVGSLVVGGLPNVKERGRRELFRDVSSINFMDYVHAGRLSGHTYTSLHCPNGTASGFDNLRMGARLIGDIAATWRDNLPLHEAFRHATLPQQLNSLFTDTLKKTVIVSASGDPVSPTSWVYRHVKDASDLRPRANFLRVEGSHTFGEVIPWPFFAADQVGLTI